MGMQFPRNLNDPKAQEMRNDVFSQRLEKKIPNFLNTTVEPVTWRLLFKSTCFSVELQETLGI